MLVQRLLQVLPAPQHDKGHERYDSCDPEASDIVRNNVATLSI